MRRAGPEKFLFGSDGPWLHPGVEMAKVLALGLGKAEQSLILGGNLLKLIGQDRLLPVSRKLSTASAASMAESSSTLQYRDPWFHGHAAEPLG